MFRGDVPFDVLGLFQTETLTRRAASMVPPSVFSARVCIRQIPVKKSIRCRRRIGTSIGPSTSQRQPPEHACVFQHCRQSRGTLLFAPLASSRRTPSQQTALFSNVSRQRAQAAVADYPFEDATDTTPADVNNMDYENLSVNELKALLRSRSLKISGVKSELVDRLRIASSSDPALDNDLQQDSQIEEPSAAVEGPKEFSAGSKMTVKDLKSKLSEMGLSTKGLKNELIERLQLAHSTGNAPLAETYLSPSIEESDQSSPVISSSESPLSSLPSSESFPLADEVAIVPTIPQPRSPMTDNWIQIPLEPIPVVSLEPIDSPTPEQSPIDHLNRHISLADIASRVLNTEVSLSRMRSDLSSLPPSVETAVVSTIPQPITTALDALVQVPLQPNVPTISRESATSPSTQECSLQLSEPVSLDIGEEIDQGFTNEEQLQAVLLKRRHSLTKLYFATAFEKGMTSDPQDTSSIQLRLLMNSDVTALEEKFFAQVALRGEPSKVLREADYEWAWKMTLAEFAKARGKPFLESPVERALRKRQYYENLESLGQRSEPQDHIDAEALMPVSMRMLLPHKLHRLLSTYRPPQDSVYQLFDVMWERLDLLDHTESVRRDDNSTDYTVTFKSFNAAAAFANRVDQHWFIDRIWGHVHTIWDWQPPENTPEAYISRFQTSAILIFPSATVATCRRIAVQRGSRMTKKGFPYVQWAASVMNLLFRMRISVGQNGECRRCNVIEETSDRVTVELVFKDVGLRNTFLHRKWEHFLTSPWKDRFFAMPKVYVGYVVLYAG
jgi:SAP domain